MNIKVRIKNPVFWVQIILGALQPRWPMRA